MKILISLAALACASSALAQGGGPPGPPAGQSGPPGGYIAPQGRSDAEREEDRQGGPVQGGASPILLGEPGGGSLQFDAEPDDRDVPPGTSGDTGGGSSSPSGTAEQGAEGAGPEGDGADEQEPNESDEVPAGAPLR